MTADDWRTGPPPRPCLSCGARQAACDGKRMLSGRRCCGECDGDHTTNDDPTTTEARTTR